MMASTRRDRRCGSRPVKIPMTMPDEMAATTEIVSRTPAAPGERPWATVRYGTPHINANTVTENWVPMWVKKPSRVPGRSHTVLTLASVSRIDMVSVGYRTTVRGVLDQGEGQHHRQHADRRDRHVGVGPARVCEQGEKRDGREHLAELPADAGQLCQQGNLPRREPVRHQPEHGDERHRVPEADHRPRGDRRGQGLGECEYQLAGRHHGGAGDDQRLGAESVEQQTRRHLCAGIHDDLKDHERGEHARAGAESVGGTQTGNPKGGAVEYGDDVCE